MMYLCIVENNRFIKIRTFTGKKTPIKGSVLLILKFNKRKWNINIGGNKNKKGN